MKKECICNSYRRCAFHAYKDSPNSTKGTKRKPRNPFQGAIAEVDGTWIGAKQEPYQLYGIEKLKCLLQFHEWTQSKKYAHTKVCFRCGFRKQNKNYDY